MKSAFFGAIGWSPRNGGRQVVTEKRISSAFVGGAPVERNLVFKIRDWLKNRITPIQVEPKKRLKI
jgi:xanthine/CO dehydrogenase XdhC/CoxF family maturation factor